MNLKQQLNKKNYFLRKAYDLAAAHSPSSPLSVSLEPFEFGKSLELDETQTERIMIELVDDGFVESSLGMGMLMVTHSGLQYLREIEDRPMVASLKNSNEGTPNYKHKFNFMKQSKKLDLILRELYKYKNDGKFYSINSICEALEIPIDSFLELNKIAHRLKNDGYIETMFTHNDCRAELTTHGIDYCEENSYTSAGNSIISNNYSISLVNSPNSKVVNESNNVSIIEMTDETNNAIEKIRATVVQETTINQSTITEILECLSEIEESLKNNQKPKFAIKSLIDLASGISSIGSWVTTLGQYAGVIPLL